MAKIKTEKKLKDPSIIDGSPTKDLFITMLIRDLTLRDAIGDLVDNSVDGARFVSSSGNYDGLYVSIIAEDNKFIIEDNCGGFSVETARDYAFRFGRPKGSPQLDNSIGQFGIGMKRALFKLGNKFQVSSTTKNSSFVMEVDVDKWRKDENIWDFVFKSYEENVRIAKKDVGTKILVDNLKDDVKSNFSDNNFIKKLKSEIELEHLYNIHKGLSISINGIGLKTRQLDLIHSDDFKTAFWHHHFDDGVNVEIFAGISSDNGLDGGWYVFCNERLIIGPDTTSVTGWTGRGAGGVAEYHDQFHRFRGYVFFSAKNSSLLPWNTTKTSMDMDSPRYQFVRQQMIEMMKPIMTLLNALKRERESDVPEKSRILNHKIDKAKITPLNKIIPQKNKLTSIFKFTVPPKQKLKKGNEQKITYSKPFDQIQRAKKVLGATSNSEVGELTFDYFFENEIGE